MSVRRAEARGFAAVTLLGELGRAVTPQSYGLTDLGEYFGKQLD